MDNINTRERIQDDIWTSSLLKSETRTKWPYTIQTSHKWYVAFETETECSGDGEPYRISVYTERTQHMSYS